MDFTAPISQLNPLPGPLQDLRVKAMNYAKETGLPTRKNEDWKYTSVKELGEASFQAAALQAIHPGHDTLKMLGNDLAADCYRVVFINGMLDKTLSTLEDLPETVEWSASPEKTLSSADPQFENSFQALNVAYSSQGLWIKIAKETSLPKPIQIHFHTTSEGQGSLMVHPRVKIQVGQRSVVRILESYSSQGQETAKHLTNASTEIEMEEAVRVLHVRLQDEDLASFHIGETTYLTKKACELTSLVISSGAHLFRHHLRLPLDESGVKAKVLGLSVSTGSQHVDNTTDIDHRVGACDTEQIYKSLLDGESRAVFNGRIYIRPQAQKANSSQLNNNLLMSSKAEADSQPQLMIEADDVKAAHGSTVG
ncbi:MAG: SufD family Fe-S cluster assembly protein, partial [Bdellovibrionaceae bacterium]|nr:SufD family Fe-S cluster assembly protein [Pseudobdellovibrionaceae bacterium]